MTTKYPLAIVASFLWIGFVCAISFMEAWLKFQAPGVTLPIGLSIGRVVFSALNKVEWVFGVLIVVSLIFLNNGPFFKWEILLVVTPLILLVLQTFWVLPFLDERAVVQMQGKSVAASNLHLYYIAMEVVKVACLSALGVYLLKGKL